jgi:hypothetical protein
MPSRISVAGIPVAVTRKKIKNIHLSVYPPDGQVRLSAPVRITEDTLRVFLIAKVGWIHAQQKKLREVQRETVRDFVDRESHFVWGGRFLLKIVEVAAPPTISVQGRQLVVQIRSDSSRDFREASVHAWYRQQIRDAAEPLITIWEKKLNVRCKGLFVQRMKTRWGSCNTANKTIRLNSELAKKPKECLEYIIVHELIHLIESSHNKRFQDLMSTYLPNWVTLRNQLNATPMAFSDWKY